MNNDDKNRKIAYEFPYYTDFVAPKGALTTDKRSHACFYYGMLAMKARLAAGKSIDSQIIMYKVGETPAEWMKPRDVEIARSVALIYALESPEEFLQFRKEAWTQMVAIGVAVEDDIFTVTPDRKFH